MGPVLEFEVDALVAVTGAQFDLQLDGAAVASNTSYAARCGHRLVFGSRLEGARAYVAVWGRVRRADGARQSRNARREWDGRCPRQGTQER